MSALGAVVLSVACTLGPYFPELWDGPICTPERQMVECGCTECLTWDPVDPSTFDFYEVSRRTVSTGMEVVVGELWCQWCEGWFGEMVCSNVWCPAKDCAGRACSFPRDGVVYEYRVRAVKVLGDGTRVGGGWSPWVRYVGTTYACYDNGAEVPCYVGDRVVSR